MTQSYLMYCSSQIIKLLIFSSLFYCCPSQILMGDFNAEPEEVSIQYLLDEANFNPASASCEEFSSAGSSLSCTEESVQVGEEHRHVRQSPFVDAWSHVQAARGLTVADDAGLTFPACNPVKRIDFILVRNSSSAEAAGGNTPGIFTNIVDFQIDGIKPTADTGNVISYTLQDYD